MTLPSVLWCGKPHLILSIEGDEALISDKRGERTKVELGQLSVGPEIETEKWKFLWAASIDKQVHLVKIADFPSYCSGHLPVEKGSESVPVVFSKYYQAVDRLKNKKIRDRKRAMAEGRLNRRSPEQTLADDLISSFAARFYFIAVRMNEVTC